MGVSFFFVLSGFILCYVYSGLQSAADTRRFYVARIACVWPLHLLTLAFAALFLEGYDTERGIEPFIANAFLLQSWWPRLSSVYSYNSVYWSISCEAFLYLVFPAVMLWRRQFGVIFLATALVIVLACLVGGYGAVTPLSEKKLPSWYTFIQHSPIIRVGEFLTGVGLGLLWLKLSNVRMPVWCWTLFEALSVALAALHATTVGPVHAMLQSAIGPIGAHWYLISGGLVASGMLIFCMAYHSGLIGRLLSLPALVLLGEISFSTYMVHQLILRFWVGQGWITGQRDLAGLAGILLAIYVASYLRWRYFEGPARGFISWALGATR